MCHSRNITSMEKYLSECTISGVRCEDSNGLCLQFCSYIYFFDRLCQSVADPTYKVHCDLAKVQAHLERLEKLRASVIIFLMTGKRM